MSIRPIKQIIEAKPTIEGAGVHLRRAFGFGNTKEFDPFLLFDDFRNDNPEERVDTKILEVLIDLDPGVQLPIGLPVDIKADASRKNIKLSDAGDLSKNETGTAFKHTFNR